MQTVAGRRNGHRAISFLLALAVLAGGILFFPASASAHPGGKAKHGGRGWGHGHRKHGHHVVVPRYIAADWRAHYSPYLAGRVYYAPHHHHHARYLFPVYVNDAVVYQPYLYCGSRLIVSNASPLPYLAFGFQVGSPGGFVVGGSYSSAYGGGYDD